MPTKFLASTMILAAGRGERMRPLTDITPKPLVEVAGKPLIQHHVERLVSAGFDHIVINLAHLGSQISDALGDGTRFGAKIRYSLEPDGGLETAGGIVQALDLLDSQFLVVNGDIWTDYDFSRFREFHLTSQLAHLLMVDTPAYKKQADFILTETGLLLPLEQAPVNAGQQDLTYSGIAMMSKDLFAGCANGRLPLLPLFNAAMDLGRLRGEYYAGVWDDVGTVARLDALRCRLAAD